MSLITRCTNCETLFKVVPDQLRISEGWVRCGQCGEVFDATLGLMENGPEVQRDETPAVKTQISADPTTTLTPTVPGLAAADKQLAADADNRPVATTAGPAPMAADAVPGTPDSTSPDVAEHAQLSFMRTPVGKSVWRHPAMRVALACASLGLLVLLLLQVLYHERDRIAAMQPVARPALSTLCALAGCRLAPLRQIESIVIDSSVFERIRADNYRLGFSLRNTATIEIAMPAVELSVTDAQDQTLIRRVFLPAEFAASTPVLAGAAEWSANLVLGVKTSTSSERVSGYRLLMFYP